jgi:hypothetical protein
MTENSHLWTILGIEETTINEIKRLDLLLQNFQKADDYNKIKVEDDIDILISILNGLFDIHYDKIKKIDIKKRCSFYESVRDKLRPMQDKFFNNNNITDQKQNALREGTKLLRILCSYNFNIKPLAFAGEALGSLNTLKHLQNELINLIEQIRLKNPMQLGTFLDDRYQAIKQNHQDIVVTLLGCLKSSKSSLIDFLLEDQICPTDNTEATARLTKIIYGQQIRLSLISSVGEKQDLGEFNNTRELLKKATELIKLKGEDRKSELCKDEVIIELPIDELKNVQLWDIPGFDENSLIDERIKEILNDTDLIFAVMPQNDGVKQSFIDFVKPYLKQNHNMYNKESDKSINNQRKAMICFLISRIDEFKPDQQTFKTQDDILQHIYDQLEHKLDINLSDTNVNNDDDDYSYKRSCKFVPICSDPRYSLKHYLECRQQFIEKSCKWFEIGLKNIIYDRLDYLLKTLHELFYYDDICRIFDRCVYVEKIFEKRYQEFMGKLKNTLEVEVNDVHSIVLNSVDELVSQCTKFDKENREAQYIEEYVKNQITIKFNDALANKQVQIKQQIIKMFKSFSNSFNFGPENAQILDEVLSEALSENPYKVKMGQYQHKVLNTKFNYMKRIARAMLDSVLGILPFANSEYYHSSSCTFVSPQGYTKYQIQTSIKNLVDEIIASIKNELHDKTIQTLEKVLTEYCDRIIGSIQAKKQKFMPAATTDASTTVIVKAFLKKHSLQFTYLYLNILDKQFDMKYSTLNVDQTDKLGESSYPVFKGTLGENNQPIAAKLIPLKKFKVQEVRYIYDLKHVNIMKYYGVKKYDDENYYIIMPRLDSDLNQYIYKNGTNLNCDAIDQMILQIIRGLDSIHTELELIHRDIKPDNILVKEDGPLFLIADFGLIHREPLTIAGTPGYIAPELLSKNNPGEITNKCDIYSLGITIQKIIELSNIKQPHDQLIIMWLKVAKSCCAKTPHHRPSCQELLEYRARYNQISH